MLHTLTTALSTILDMEPLQILSWLGLVLIFQNGPHFLLQHALFVIFNGYVSLLEAVSSDCDANL